MKNAINSILLTLAIFVVAPLAQATTATQSYLGTADLHTDEFSSSCYTGPASPLHTTGTLTQVEQVMDSWAANWTADQASGCVSNQTLTIPVPWTRAANTQGEAYGDYLEEYQWSFTNNSGSHSSIFHVGITIACPNGGAIEPLGNTQYPGWCIVNGQPPPNGECAANYAAETDHRRIITYPAGQTPVPAGQTMNDGSGCTITVGAAVMIGPNYYQQEGIEQGTTYTGNATQTPTLGTPSSQGMCAPNTTVCVGGNDPNGFANANLVDPEQSGTVDGQPITIPGSIPPNGCVSTASGGMFCMSDAPPPMDNSSPPQVIPPDTTVTVTGTGGTITTQYYNSSTVNGSTNYGNGKGSTTTTTTTTNPDGSTTTNNQTTYPNPTFPGVDSVQQSVDKENAAVASAPITQAASSVFNQTMGAGTCPPTSFTLKSLRNASFDFGVCSLWQQYEPELAAAFIAMWILIGATIMLSA